MAVAEAYERVAKFVDDLLTFDVDPEKWRVLEVSIGGELGAGDYSDNSITTHKYNALTFLPRSLFEQFRRTANQYFLLISLLMIIRTYTDLFYSPRRGADRPAVPDPGDHDDQGGHRGPEAAQERRAREQLGGADPVELARGAPGTVETVAWKAIAPGQIVLVKDREEIPADLVLLWSSEGAQCYVETSNIDGETNLKIKRPATDSASAPLFPHPDNFEGTLKHAGGEIALDASQFLLRGSTLRNTKLAIGVVAYTGKDTRLVRNSRDVPSKLSELERVVNNMVLFILGAMVCITTISVIAYCLWNESNKKDLWYMCYRYKQDGVPALFDENCSNSDDYSNGSMWFTFFILYNNFIPISLYVTIEMINYCQAAYVDGDLEMYDEASDTPALARTSNMNADLGMIAHVFSDKTGTLTQNIMKFKRCAVGGGVYGGETVDPPRRIEALKQLVITGDGVERDYAAIMAVCHTVVPEVREDGTTGYQAESPDEEALVEGACDLGLAFASRTVDVVDVTLASPSGTKGTSLSYTVLATIPFDSTRKRMSAIVRLPNGKVRVMTKGADNIVFGLADAAAGYARVPGGREALDADLEKFARDGLRTLVLAQRDRAEKLVAAAALIEKDLAIVGATAIEDKLQDGVPSAIAELAKAEIKLWLEALEAVVASAALASSGGAPVASPASAPVDTRKVPLMGVAGGDATATGARVASAKRILVGLVRRKTNPAPITLAIGDGANDVGMIQEANIGVGISGKEGRQAVNNADFAIAQFRFLKPLLFHHGRKNYRRMSKVIIYSFFKNIVLTFVLFYFQADCAWSGTSFYESWVYSGFNFFLGLIPLAMGFFDHDVADATVDKYPRLYAAGLHRMDLNVTNMAYGTLEAIAASLAIYYLTREVYWRPMSIWQDHGKAMDVWVLGTAVFVGMVMAMMARACLLVDSWSEVQLVFVVLQHLMLFTFIIFMAQAYVAWYGFLDYDYYGVAYRARSVFWLVSCVLVPAVVSALQILVLGVHLDFFPSINDIGKELDHGHVDGEHLHHHPQHAFIRLRPPASVHALVASLFGTTDSARSTFVTRESVRDVHATIGKEQSKKLGIHEDVASSARRRLGTGAGAGSHDERRCGERRRGDGSPHFVNYYDRRGRLVCVHALPRIELAAIPT
ncbi:phospholipid-translocating ATPase [Aureococcus anophagefferens]|nr:phospholipid-translocating ATPase [Aureococcus anophagefferens]